jgi:hypothetical protein
MKKLLLSCLMLVSGYGAFAQASCAAATNITANGTFTSGAITGTYSNPCYGGTTNNAGAAIKARWWKYTPTANGEITVTSDLAANPIATTDTRVSVLKGTCAALTCMDYNDDVDPAAATPNYKSTVTVPVASGTTYYIEWDNYWAATSFTFQFTFTATPCVRPGALDFYRPDSYTTNSASLYWNNAIGDPASYDIDWSTNFADLEGTGTIVNVPAGTTGTPLYTQGDLSGLPDNLNFRYFVRSNCGATQSAWQGPYFGYLAAVLPYANDFESPDNNYTDGFIGFARLNSDATATPPIYGDGDAGYLMYTPNSTTAASDRWAYSRALSLTAGEVVTLGFKTRAYTATTASDLNLDVTVGTIQTSTGQTTVLDSFVESDDTQYTDRSVTYTAPADGIYYFGFHNNSAAGATQTYLFFDTLNISSVLSTNNFLASKLSVYPNPATNVINISSTINTTINKVEMTDLNGRVVMTQNVNATSGQIAIADLATGVYMMKISTDQGTAVKKIVKQ